MPNNEKFTHCYWYAQDIFFPLWVTKLFPARNKLFLPVYSLLRIISQYFLLEKRESRCTILAAWGWCTGTTQRDGIGKEEGGGFMMGNTCIPVADSF